MLQPTNLTASLPRMAQTITLGAISTILLTLVTTSTIVDLARADANQDRDQCAQQLVGLATCLPYVGGDAKAPTPDCCNGLKQVLKSNKKCLCVVVRDRNDPELGLNINATLALGLPSVCHAPANVSQCPALLHMDPNSPEAQVFNQFGKSSNPGASTPSLSPTGAISPTPGSNSLAPTASAPMKTIINKFYTSGIMSFLVITFFYMHHDLLM